MTQFTAKSVHEEEMNRSSSQGSRSLSASLHGHREASFRGSYGGGDFKTEETAGEVSEVKGERTEPFSVREEGFVRKEEQCVV